MSDWNWHKTKEAKRRRKVKRLGALTAAMIDKSIEGKIVLLGSDPASKGGDFSVAVYGIRNRDGSIVVTHIDKRQRIG